MKDARWAAAYRALLPKLASTDVVLVPRGDWGAFSCAVRLYDAVIELGDATVLVLHKGRLTGLAKAELAGIVRDWGCLFANDVLVAYARSKPSAWADRLGLYHWHKRRVHDHLRSRALRRLPATIFYVHIPKTGGTAVLFALRRLLRSSVYFTTTEAFLAHPPAPGDYDFVAVHAHASLVTPLMREGDILAGLVRDPVRRFLSGVAHSRRGSEDVETFTPGLRAMREQDLATFLGTEAGRTEARLQLVLLGSSHQPHSAEREDDAMLGRALELTAAPHSVFAASSQSQAFLSALLARFGLRAPMLPRRNVNTRTDYDRHTDEFMRAGAMLDILQDRERRLVAAIRERFVRCPAR